MTDDALEQDQDRAAANAGPESPSAGELPAGEAVPSDLLRIEALQHELSESQDRLLRKAAEFDNYRKRTERERREQADRTVTDLLLEMLVVVDDLERALKADVAPGGAGAYREGVEIIYRKILDMLRRRDVRPIEAVGVGFDPNVHQAVAAEPAEGRRDGEILEELRRGYMIGDRLLRPAMVKVART